MTANKKRLNYISNAKIIGILLVVLGHSYPFNVEIPVALKNLQVFIYCFHMPLFVFVSAFLVTKINSLQRHGCKKYVLSRAKKLFIPYIFMSLIGLLPKLLLENFINDDVEVSFTYFIKAFFVPRDNIWGHFWFIPMIFILAGVTIPYIYMLKKNKIISILVCVISFALLFTPKITGWFALNDVKDYLCWYLLGLLLGSEEKFENVLNNKVLPIVTVVCSLFCFYFKFYGYKPIIAILMILFVLCLSNIVNFEKSGLLQKIEKCNFTIYILSWPAQAVVEVVANRVLGLPMYIVMLFMFLAGIAIPLLICLFFDWLNTKFNIKFLNLIIGY